MELPIGAMIALKMAIGTAPIDSHPHFTVDEVMCGYAETPKSICAPSPMEIEFEKMYKGPYKNPQEKEWDKMIKR